MLPWPELLVASGYVFDNAGSPELVGASGIVATVTDLGVGHYSVNLRAPGVPGFTTKGAIAIVTPVSAAFASASASFSDADTLIVRIFDAAAAALDGSFSFLILLNERAG